MALTPHTIGYYPAHYTRWDNRAHTLRLDRLDEQIRESTRANYGLSQDFLHRLRHWHEPIEHDHYYQLPLQQLIRVAAKSQLQFRALLALSVIWSVKEGHRAKQNRRFRNTHIYATLPNGELRPEALRRMPHMTPDQLACLCYTHHHWNDITKQHRYRAKQALRTLHRHGYIHVITPTQIARPYTPPWIQR